MKETVSGIHCDAQLAAKRKAYTYMLQANGGR